MSRPATSDLRPETRRVDPPRENKNVLKSLLIHLNGKFEKDISMKFPAVKVIFFYHGHFSRFLMSVSCARKLWEKAGRKCCMFFHALVASLTKLV